MPPRLVLQRLSAGDYCIERTDLRITRLVGDRRQPWALVRMPWVNDEHPSASWLAQSGLHMVPFLTLQTLLAAIDEFRELRPLPVIPALPQAPLCKTRAGYSGRDGLVLVTRRPNDNSWRRWRVSYEGCDHSSSFVRLQDVREHVARCAACETCVAETEVALIMEHQAAIAT
jgi:hypothetical protein